jgi:uncharacterized protein
MAVDVLGSALGRACGQEQRSLMKCPVCREPDLMMTDRQSIEIDYCPRCRGVWLDRGELDKLIERSAAQPSLERAGSEPIGDRESHRYRLERRHDDDDDDEGRYPRKRRGFLGEFFDFD